MQTRNKNQEPKPTGHCSSLALKNGRQPPTWGAENPRSICCGGTEAIDADTKPVYADTKPVYAGWVGMIRQPLRWRRNNARRCSFGRIYDVRAVGNLLRCSCRRFQLTRCGRSIPQRCQLARISGRCYFNVFAMQNDDEANVVIRLCALLLNRCLLHVQDSSVMGAARIGARGRRYAR